MNESYKKTKNYAWRINWSYFIILCGFLSKSKLLFFDEIVWLVKTDSRFVRWDSCGLQTMVCVASRVYVAMCANVIYVLKIVKTTETWMEKTYCLTYCMLVLTRFRSEVNLVWIVPMVTEISELKSLLAEFVFVVPLKSQVWKASGMHLPQGFGDMRVNILNCFLMTVRTWLNQIFFLTWNFISSWFRF